jgi:large subunit ribosomal protein L21
VTTDRDEKSEMSTYAIVESGGKQYRVEKGQSLLVDRIAEDEGAKVPLRAVMFRSDGDVVIAPKDLEKVKVEAKVAGHERGEKIRVFKYKAKKGYRKRHGHRSELTRLEVTEVKLLTRKPAAAKEKAAEGKESEADPAKKQAAGSRQQAAKKATAKKEPAAKKPAAKKPAAKKPAAKKAPAKKPAAKKPAAEKKESD